MQTYLYIIYSSKINKYYVGISRDPERRLSFHNLGKAGRNAYTKRADDWQLLYTKVFDDISSAKKFEKHIKRQKKRQYIEKIVRSAPR